ncbi:MAG: sensor domain-containing diguanylate cyclase [Planctomycetes bacterium]|nr:sensor domain-containing diguanylate cyclase [Planctomycetota bacterium]
MSRPRGGARPRAPGPPAAAREEVQGLLDGRLEAALRDRVLEVVDRVDAERAAHQREFKRLTLDFATVVEVTSQINSKSLDLALIENFTLNMVMGQFGVLKVCILRRDNDDSGHVVPVLGKNTRLPPVAFEVDAPFARDLVRAARPVGLEDPALAAHPESATLRAEGFQLVVPLLKSGAEREQVDLMGVLCLGERFDRARGFDAGTLRFLSLLGNMVAISLFNAQLYHRSIYDGLTRVHSRGYFEVALTQELDRTRRQRARGGPEENRKVCSLVMVDLDRFKSVNDTHGHPVGDEVLRRLAKVLASGLRSSDVVARYGGEEFTLILPETDKKLGTVVADRLRRRVRESAVPLPGGGEIHVSVSMGMATFPDDADEIQALVREADRALYRAKDLGRDRLCVCGAPVPIGPGGPAPDARASEVP